MDKAQEAANLVLLQYGAIGAILVYVLGLFTTAAGGIAYASWWGIHQLLGKDGILRQLTAKHITYLDNSTETLREVATLCKINFERVETTAEDTKNSIEDLKMELKVVKGIAEAIVTRIRKLEHKAGINEDPSITS